MLGLYVHIPFCRRACAYCDFFFVTRKSFLGGDSQSVFADALSREIFSYARDECFSSQKLSSIYFGGGTPSLFFGEVLTRVMQMIKKSFLHESHQEITIEANPEDINAELVRQWRTLGFNRISLGVQSLWPSSFTYLGRKFIPHEEVLKKINLLSQFGFDNINVDLIVGFSGLEEEHIVRDLSLLAEQTAVKHFSVYLLTVEDRTRLKKEIELKKKSPIVQELQARQYMVAGETLKKLGFERYEVSNYCRDGFHSRHNSHYWQGKPYLGVGPSAHSFDGGRKRRVNVSHFSQYITRWEKEHTNDELWPKDEVEWLDDKMLYEEMLITRLRRKQGLSFTELREKVGEEYVIHLQKTASPFLKKGILEQFSVGNSAGFRFSEEGILFADGVICDLFP